MVGYGQTLDLKDTVTGLSFGGFPKTGVDVKPYI